MGAKEIILSQCKSNHLSLKDLQRRTSIKTLETFEKKLDDPLSFTIRDINQICIVLNLPDEQKNILKGEIEFETWNKKCRE